MQVRTKTAKRGFELLKTIEFSVVIPMLNGGRRIDDQLDALSHQLTNVVWEVVVADNGSTDDGPKLVNSRIESFPVPLKIIDASEKPGVAFARNIGAAAAHGKTLGFCDCDDRVSPTWVDSAAQALRKFDAVCGPRKRLGDQEDELDWPPETSFGPLLLGNNFGLTRRAFDALGTQGAFDENLPPYGGEDIDLSIRVSELGLSISIVPQMTVDFRAETSKVTALKKVFSSSLAEVAIWHKHELRFRKNRGLLRALGNLALVPLEVLRSRSFRKALRALVRRCAHVVAQMPIEKSTKS